MSLPVIQELARLVAESALNSIGGGLLIAGLAWLLLRAAGGQNSGTRFAIWFSALIAIAGLPFMPGLNHRGIATHAMHAQITLPNGWALAIFAVWISCAVLGAVRIFFGLRSLRRLRRSGVALAPSELHPALRETLAKCEAVRPVTVCSSSAVQVPMAIGFFRPAILIPDWALRDLPVEELNIVLLHEFAHLNRWDDWTNLAQKIVRVFFFFHPAVWWIGSRISLEREMACDDAVLAKTGDPRAYAECLVSLAEKSFLQRSLEMAQAAISRACETSIRLAQILDTDRPLATRVSKPALGLMAALAGACLIMLPHAPQLIAFKDAVQPRNFVNASATPPLGMQAAVVPVTLRSTIDSAGKIATGKVLATPAVYRSSFKHHDSAGQAGTRQGRRRSSVPVAVTAIQTTRPEFVVVMQTAEFREQGSVVWSVAVWRVTLAVPNPVAAHEGVAVKKI